MKKTMKRILGMTLAALMLVAMVAACAPAAPAPPAGGGGAAAGGDGAAAGGGAADAPAGHHGYDINNVDTSDWVRLDMNYATFLPAENAAMNLNWTNQLAVGQELMGEYFDFTLFPLGTLLSQGDSWEGVLAGTAPIAFVDFAITPELLPLTTLWSFPSNNVGGTVAATAAFNEWMNILQPAEFNDVVLLSVQAAAGTTLSTSFRWERMEDLAGRQIGAMPALHPTLTALGAIPVNIPTADVYDAARSGLIEGMFWTIGATVNVGAQTYLPYQWFSQMGTGHYLGVIMNRPFYESLPQTQREFLREVFRRAMWERIVVQQPHRQDVFPPALEALAAGQMEVFTIDPVEHQRMRDTVAYLRDDYVADLIARGVPDAQRAADLLDEMTDKWRGWYTMEKFMTPFLAAMEGDHQRFIDDPSLMTPPPLPEVYGWTPSADR